ncbi:MAG: TonB-dependent receptor [Draconibacterium sp.]|nr:TonB-dependent receptor [Draconibacterium sp.]
MKKRNGFLTGDERSLFRRIVRSMKLTTFILLASTMMVSASLYSQGTKVTLKFSEISYQDMFKEIENQTEFRFAFSSSKLDPNQKVEVDVKKKTLEEILDEKLPEGITYEIIDRYVVIINASEKKSAAKILQQNPITGTVTDEAGQPLPGVTVVVKGSTQGTVTNADGNYSIGNLPSDAMLVFSFVGMRTQEIKVGDQTSINIALQIDAFGIEEVVAIGYGSIRKSDLTGSVASVDVEQMATKNITNLNEGLQGLAAGVQVLRTSGRPGASANVIIRGVATINNSTAPLYVVDGIMVGTDANFINPNDIASIEILKDASATAIYGSRGANGVIMISTKSGTKGKASLNFKADFGLQTPGNKIEVADMAGFTKVANQLAINDNKDPNPDWVNPANLNYIDWQDEMYEMGFSHNEGVTFSGSNDKTNYYFSAGYGNIKGIVETSDIKKGDLRLNLSTELTPKLKFDNRISLTYQTGTFAQLGGRAGSSRSFTKQILSYRPVLGAAGDQIDDIDLDISNPFSWITDFDDLTEEVRANISTSLEYEIIKGLKYKLRGGVDYRAKDRSRWYDTGIRKGELVNAAANYSNMKRYSYTIDNILSYVKRINRDNRINATAAITYDGSNLKNSIYEIENFPVKVLRSKAPQLGSTLAQPYALLYREEAIFSALGRVNYNFKDKYILTASFRADQSSKFATDNQWGYFPSAAVAWRASEESFIKDLDVFHNLKVRLGWGLTGNQAIQPYQTLSTYSTAYYVDAGGNTLIGSVPARIANPDLTWETTEQYNGGVDISVFSGRLNLTVDAYYKITSDLLQDIQLPTSAGFSSMTINRGEIINKGIEFSLDGLIVNKKDFSIDAGAHISFNRGKIGKLGISPSSVWRDGVEYQESYYMGRSVSTGTYFKSPANIFMEDQPIGMFWGYETNGIYADQTAAENGSTNTGNVNQAGDIIYVDQNLDGNIDDKDFTFIGDPNPEFMFGFDFSINYKGFTLKALFDGVYGNEIANGYTTELGIPETSSKNILASAYENAWREGEVVNAETGPRIGYTLAGMPFSDFIIEDGSYLRLNNVTLGYDLPIKSNVFSNINIYVSGRNLFYLTNYSGYEPQVTSYIFDGGIIGVDWVGTPNVKTVLAGINITF